MAISSIQKNSMVALVLISVLVAGGAGYWFGALGSSAATQDQSGEDGSDVLYYYDPMFPQQKFDKPGKSPFMDMQLVPKYAGDNRKDDAPSIAIDPEVAQNLGIRTAEAKIGKIASNLRATGTIEFNDRDVANVEARSAGFVQRTYRRAPTDIVAKGAPLADVLVPEWGSAQAEYIALARGGNAAFANAAKTRMRLLGMPDSLIQHVVKTGQPHSIYTIRSPIGGVIQSLDVRQGMTLTQGQPLARINGLGSIWLNVAIPEARSSQIRVGQSAIVQLQSFPKKAFQGRVIAILPTAESASRTVTARIELANKGGRLRPGMFATIDFEESGSPMIVVPSEAIVETGTRTLVMLATGEGRYRPAEVRKGREGGGQTEIITGLSPGEKVIVSGQFLVDSEASLSGISVRPIAAGQ